MNGRGVLSILIALCFIVSGFCVMSVLALSLETKEFSDNIVFVGDGYLSHYYVERANVSLSAEVYVYHPNNSYDATVHTTNVRVLLIDVQSLYDDEWDRCWYVEPDDFRLWFVSRAKYNLTFVSDGLLERVVLISAENLEPKFVVMNGTQIDFDVSNDVITINIPDHSNGTVYSVGIYYDGTLFLIEEGASLFNRISVFFLVCAVMMGVYMSLSNVYGKKKEDV